MASYAVGGNLTAAGTNLATAAAIDGKSNVYTIGTGTAGQGVQLPVAKSGYWCQLTNSSSAPMLVYPQTGYTVGTSAASAGFSLPVNESVEFFTADGANWTVSPDNLSGSQSYNKPVVVASLTGTTTLTVAQGGSLVNIGVITAARAINLPTTGLYAGLQYDFFVTGSLAAGAATIGAGSAIIQGNAVATNATAVVGPSGTAKSNIVLGTGSVIGDWVRLICVDGTNWVAQCMITTNTTLTVS